MNEAKHKINLKWISKSINIVFYIIIFVLIVFSIANMKLKEKNDVANVFGYGFISVLTDSMDGDQDDSFTVDDLLFVKLANDEARQSLQVGDIVTYYSLDIPGLGVQGFITHRIVELGEFEGVPYVITQGDKQGAPLDDPINISEVIAVNTGKLENAGRTLKYLQSPTGFAIAVILPTFFILVYEAVLMVRNIMQINKEKIEKKMASEKEATLQTLELEKEKIRQQIIQEMNAQKNQSN